MTDDVRPSPTTNPLDEEGGRALVEAWRASGQSGAAFCRQQGLRPQRLHYWRERLGYPIKGVRPSSSDVVTLAAAPQTAGFVQMIVRPEPSDSHVEIVVGGAAIRVRVGFDPVLLRSLVAALRDEA